MQVRTANDVKVYNLSAGKSVPEWISDRKRRALLKNDLGTPSWDEGVEGMYRQTQTGRRGIGILQFCEVLSPPQA